MRPAPSHSVEAEESVIGGVLLHSQAFAKIRPLVDKDDFYHPALAAVWEAIVDCDASGFPIDTISVVERMKALGTVDKLRAFDGPDFLTELMGKVVTVENIEFHARIVRQKARRRKMQAQLSELAAAGLDPETDDEAFFAAVDGASFAAGEVVERKRIKQVLRSVIAELGERMRLRKEGGTGLVGIPTGFEQLDAWTGGLRAGKLYVVGARPKMGKSAFAGNVVEQSALLGIPWLVFSAEMLANELGERMIASRGGIDTTALNNGLLSQRDWVMLTKAASDLAETQVQFVDRRGLRIGQVIAEARRWRAELDAKAKGERPRCGIVVDYLQLFLPDKEDRNREREVAAISRGLKELAGICECPVVALAQLNRELEKRDDKRPRPADLRDSGSVEQDADLLAFLYRDEVYDPRPENPHRGVAELIISLARGIPTGTLYFTWQGEHTRFRQLDNPPPPKGKASRNGHAHGEPMPHWMDDR